VRDGCKAAKLESVKRLGYVTALPKIEGEGSGQAGSSATVAHPSAVVRAAGDRVGIQM